MRTTERRGSATKEEPLVTHTPSDGCLVDYQVMTSLAAKSKSKLQFTETEDGRKWSGDVWRKTRRICPYIPAATMFRMIIGKGFQLPFILVINLVSIVILCTTIYHTPSFSS